METLKKAPIGDRNFETRHAEALIESLENALAAGLKYVVFELQPMETAMHPGQLNYYDDEEDATDDWEMKTTGGDLPGDNYNPVYYRQTDQFLNEIRRANAPQSQYMIGDTLFQYSAYRDTFIQKDYPLNEIPMSGKWEDQLWTQFFFDKQTKNIYQGKFPNGERPAHVALVITPTLPYCNKQGITVKPYEEKSRLENNQVKRQRMRRIS